MDDKLQEVLAALERGEEPVCPWCGEAFQGTQVYMSDIVSPEIRTQVARHSWYCGTYTEGASWSRSTPCWQHTVNALRERVADAVARLERACAESSLGGDVEWRQVDNALRILQGQEPVDYDAKEDA